ncbi:DUF2057 domain-containing protein [Shewanella abyssi]|uniref:DUF2057 family protein n=1 Tax=Shewanella abyssi TaxID=311789 RepID=UPI00200E8184|nr:DUF2057 family protein [Shewanella abyssi]MCL1049823.1 DUF2057 domain-containing protein [Shewanella abyssi]
MKLLTKAVLAAIIATSSASVFAASVFIPSGLQVSEINGVQVNNSQEFELAEGQNLIKLTYLESFAVNADDSGSLVKSKPLFWHVSAQEGVDYTVSLPVLMTQDEARDYIQHPVIQISDSKGLTRTDSLPSQSQLMAALFTQKVDF